MIQAWFVVYAVITGALLLAAFGLQVVCRLGLRGIGEWFGRAPGLDLWIAYFTIAPMIGGPIALAQTTADGGVPVWLRALLGFVAGALAMATALVVWCRVHELMNRRHVRGPRIVRHLNKAVGPLNNHFALWWTTIALPTFASIRIAQIVVYPVLTWTIRLPKYKTGEWVNVSRYKFEGLVGHDLVWCLYCDWMTGLWSLGSEMLRNLESFWCPIRFYPDKKCENCVLDFPDIDGGWVPADGSMADVVGVLEEKVPGPGGENPWFGHPARLTVEGESPVVPRESADRA